jgi:ubiquinone/menaquinone biosynthesis C-methylase UbiE
VTLPAHFTTLTSTAFDRAYYEQHKAAGLDYAHYGPWQRDYATWLVDALGLRGRSLLDIGCACGNMAAAFAERGLSAVGIDVCEHMISLGRQRFPDVRLEICDAANLHLFGPHQFGVIHSHQSAEHWPVDLVPRILHEARRVAAADALFFCVLDTVDVADRSGRDLAAEDPTHVCLRPLTWWKKQLAAAGWRWANEEIRHALAEHEKSYLVEYDWDWWVCRPAN